MILEVFLSAYNNVELQTPSFPSLPSFLYWHMAPIMQDTWDNRFSET